MPFHCTVTSVADAPARIDSVLTGVGSLASQASGSGGFGVVFGSGAGSGAEAASAGAPSAAAAGEDTPLLKIVAKSGVSSSLRGSAARLESVCKRNGKSGASIFLGGDVGACGSWRATGAAVGETGLITLAKSFWVGLSEASSLGSGARSGAGVGAAVESSDAVARFSDGD